MKKVLKKLACYTRIAVLFVPTFLWWLGLYICGIVIQYKQARKEKPYLSRTDAFCLLDANAIGERAFREVSEKIGRPNAKWGS